MGPPSPKAAPFVPAAYPLGAALLTTCAATAILYLRRPIAFLHPQFYAEDGAIFFQGAEADPLGTILSPYAGYLLVAHRLVACLASHADLRSIPGIYFAASLLAFTGLELAIFSPRLNLPRPWLLGLAVVLIPHSGEVFCNLTNTQWITGLGLILLAMAQDPQGPGEWALDLGYAALAGLTGVFSIVFAPLFVARAALRRTGGSLCLAAVVLSAAAVQYHAIALGYPHAASGRSGAAEVVATFGTRVWLSLLLPPGATDAAPFAIRIAAGVLGFLLLAALAAGPRENRRVDAVMAPAILLLFAAVVFRFRGNLDAFHSVIPADRYFFIPKVCVAWILASHIGATSRWRWTARLLLLWVLVNGCVGFRFDTWKDYNWPYWASRIETEDEVEVPTNPPGFTFVHHRPLGPRPGP